MSLLGFFIPIVIFQLEFLGTAPFLPWLSGQPMNESGQMFFSNTTSLQSLHFL